MNPEARPYSISDTELQQEDIVELAERVAFPEETQAKLERFGQVEYDDSREDKDEALDSLSTVGTEISKDVQQDLEDLDMSVEDAFNTLINDETRNDLLSRVEVQKARRRSSGGFFGYQMRRAYEALSSEEGINPTEDQTAKEVLAENWGEEEAGRQARARVKETLENDEYDGILERNSYLRGLVEEQEQEQEQEQDEGQEQESELESIHEKQEDEAPQHSKAIGQALVIKKTPKGFELRRRQETIRSGHRFNRLIEFVRDQDDLTSEQKNALVREMTEFRRSHLSGEEQVDRTEASQSEQEPEDKSEETSSALTTEGGEGDDENGDGNEPSETPTTESTPKSEPEEEPAPEPVPTPRPAPRRRASRPERTQPQEQTRRIAESEIRAREHVYQNFQKEAQNLAEMHGGGKGKVKLPDTETKKEWAREMMSFGREVYELVEKTRLSEDKSLEEQLTELPDEVLFMLHFSQEQSFNNVQDMIAFRHALEGGQKWLLYLGYAEKHGDAVSLDGFTDFVEQDKAGFDSAKFNQAGINRSQQRKEFRHQLGAWGSEGYLGKEDISRLWEARDFKEDIERRITGKGKIHWNLEKVWLNYKDGARALAFLGPGEEERWIEDWSNKEKANYINRNTYAKRILSDIGEDQAARRVAGERPPGLSEEEYQRAQQQEEFVDNMPSTLRQLGEMLIKMSGEMEDGDIENFLRGAMGGELPAWGQEAAKKVSRRASGASKSTMGMMSMLLMIFGAVFMGMGGERRRR